MPVRGMDIHALAAAIPRLLRSTENPPHNAGMINVRDLIRSHAKEPPVVSSISSILRQPSKSDDDRRVISTAMNCISHLPEDQLVLYRPALADLNNIDASGQSDRRSTGFLALQAKDMIRFVDDRAATWTPTHKGDDMAQRSLRERVHTAEQMRPHVAGLLTWLQDCNWPPYSDCEKQLARFPELAVDEIKSTIAKPQNRDDGEWILNMLCFVEKHVPVGTLWDKLYPQVLDIANNPTKSLEESGLLEYVPGWITTVDKWRNKTDKAEGGIGED